MKDTNEFRFSGTVESFRRIETKTGLPMIAFTVRCWRELIRTVAFKEIAERTELAAGDRIEVRGHIQSTEWQDKDGNRRSGWQVIANEIDTDQQHEQPRPPARQQPAHQGNLSPNRRPDTGARFQYEGGPF